MRGESQEREVRRLTNKVYSNQAFLTKEDLEVLEFLGNKGSFNDKKVIFAKYKEGRDVIR